MTVSRIFFKFVNKKNQYGNMEEAQESSSIYPTYNNVETKRKLSKLIAETG